MKLLLAFALLLMGCAPYFHHFPETIYIDPAFTVEEQVQIVAALDDWREATHGYVDERPVIGYKPEDNRGSHQIFRAHSRDSQVQRNHSSPTKFGFARINTFWGTKRPGQIWLIMDRIPDHRMLRIVTLHELGHHYGLRHEDHRTYSIMASPFNNDRSGTITCIDVKQFEMLYGVQIGC